MQVQQNNLLMLDPPSRQSNQSSAATLRTERAQDCVGSPMTAGNRAARAVHNKLRRHFQREMMRLERSAKQVEEIEMDAVKRLSAGSIESNASFISSNIGVEDSDDSDVALSSKTKMTRFAEEEYDATLIEERRKEIEQIQSNMMKVNEVYTDLANLVDEQQVEIDDIEQNIIYSHSRVEAGSKQLEKATALQKNSGKCVRWVLGLIILGALVSIGVLYRDQLFSRKAKA